MDTPVPNPMHDESSRFASKPLRSERGRFWLTLRPTGVAIVLSAVSFGLHEIYWSYGRAYAEGGPIGDAGSVPQACGFMIAVAACLIGLGQLLDGLRGLVVERPATDLKLVGGCISIVFAAAAFLNSIVVW